MTALAASLKIRAWHVLTLSIVLGGSLWAAAKFYDHLSTEQINHVGFVFSVWGVFITLSGFALTLWQLSRTATAAASASIAVEKLRQDVGSFDMLSDLHHIISNVDAALERLNEKKYKLASKSYEIIRRSLNRYLTSCPNLQPLEVETAKDLLSHLIAAAGIIEILDDLEAFDTSDLRTRLREIQDLAIAKETAIRSQIGE